MVIDHVLYATADLDVAAARIETELGLRVHPGGRHVGQGTHNRIVPLGGGYLELIAVFDRDEAERSPVGKALMERIDATGEGLMAWAVATTDIAAVSERLGTAPYRIARDGLGADLTGVQEALATPYLPFFIQRDEGIADPAGDGDIGGITYLEVAGDPARLTEWLGRSPLPIRFAPGEPGIRALAIGERLVLR
jgi:hypothetical protein